MAAGGVLGQASNALRFAKSAWPNTQPASERTVTCWHSIPSREDPIWLNKNSQVSDARGHMVFGFWTFLRNPHTVRAMGAWAGGRLRKA